MRQLALVVVGAFVLVTATYGVIFHTPLKTKLGLTGGSCPFAAGQSLAQREAQRRAAAAKLRGGIPALSQPALGFDLQSGTRGKVDAWLERVGGRCAEALTTGELECKVSEASQLPGSQVRGPATVFFTFNDQHQLRSVQLMATVTKAQEAANALHAVRARLEQDLGVPARNTGEASSDYLGGGALRQALAEFRFSNYYASTRVTNMGGLGYYSVSQTYQSLKD